MYYQQPRDSATSELHASHAKPNSWADNHLQISGSLNSIIETRSFIHKIFALVDRKLLSDQQPLRTSSSEGNNLISYVLVYVLLQWIKHWVIKLNLIFLFFVKFGLDQMLQVDKDHMLPANKQIIPLLNGA